MTTNPTPTPSSGSQDEIARVYADRMEDPYRFDGETLPSWRARRIKERARLILEAAAEINAESVDQLKKEIAGKNAAMIELTNRINSDSEEMAVLRGAYENSKAARERLQAKSAAINALPAKGAKICHCGDEMGKGVCLDAGHVSCKEAPQCDGPPDSPAPSSACHKQSDALAAAIEALDDTKRLEALTSMEIEVYPLEGAGWALIEWGCTPPRRSDHDTMRVAIDTAILRAVKSEAGEKGGAA